MLTVGAVKPITYSDPELSGFAVDISLRDDADTVHVYKDSIAVHVRRRDIHEVVMFSRADLVKLLELESQAGK